MKVVKRVQLVAIVLAVQIPEHALEIMLCGWDDPKPYDNITHVCENGVISRSTNSVTVTDANVVTFGRTNSVTVKDANGVSSKITDSVRVTDSPVRANQENKTRERSSRYVTNCREDDLLLCNGRVFCGRLTGHECCGFETYRPNIQTCCQMSSAMYTIHNLRSSKYICCDLKVHLRRSGRVPCQHPASNDAFFRRVKTLSPDKLNYNTHLCMNITYAFKIHFLKQTKSKNQLYLRAVVTRYYLNHARNTILKSKKARKDIALDKHSPSREIDGKDFVILTSHDHLSDIVFYLRPSDMLFRSPKNNRLVKRLNKFLNKCKTFAAKTMNYVQ